MLSILYRGKYVFLVYGNQTTTNIVRSNGRVIFLHKYVNRTGRTSIINTRTSYFRIGYSSNEY